MNDFPRSRPVKQKNRKDCEKSGVFTGMRAEKSGYEIKNLIPTPGGLSTHTPLVCAAGQDGLENLRAIYPFDDKLLILDVSDGHLRFCLYDGGEHSVAYTAQEEYGEDFDASEFSTGLVYTEDVSQEIVSGSPNGKILYFPAHKFTLISNGQMGYFRDLPESVPHLERAAVCGGRLYGTVGQTVYISGKNGCFDWTFDGIGDEEPDPDHAFTAPITTQTEKQTPVTALKVYRGNVYIFRENAMQKIVNTSNPFAVKDVFRIGCTDCSSIRELNGLLYFISGKRAYSFNGSAITELPLPAEGAELAGPACVYDGRYCVCGRYENRHRIFSYDPESKTFGTLMSPGEIKAFSEFGGVTAALVKTANDGSKIYVFDAVGRNETAFSAMIPLMHSTHDVIELAGFSVRYRQDSTALHFRAFVNVTHDDGSIDNYDLGLEEEATGWRTARRRTLIRGAGRVNLHLLGTGSVLIESCFAHFRLKSGRKVKE